jgi:hypothetical protein
MVRQVTERPKLGGRIERGYISPGTKRAHLKGAMGLPLPCYRLRYGRALLKGSHIACGNNTQWLRLPAIITFGLSFLFQAQQHKINFA